MSHVISRGQTFARIDLSIPLRTLLLSASALLLSSCGASFPALGDKPGILDELDASRPVGKPKVETLSPDLYVPEPLEKANQSANAGPATDPVTVGTTRRPTFSGTSQEFAQAIRQALSINPQVRARISELAGAGINAEIARQAYFPTLNSSAGMGTRSDYDYEVTLSQPLFDWGHTRAGITGADAAKRAAIAALRAAEEQAALDAARAQINVQRHAELVEVAQRNVTVHERFLDLATVRSEGGVVDETEARLAAVRLGGARSELEEAHGALRDARSIYRTQIGMESRSSVRVPRLGLTVTNDTDIEALVAHAPAVQAALEREAEARQSVKLAKAELLPRLSAEAVYGATEGASSDKAGVGLRVTGPSITGLSNLKRVDAAGMAAETARWTAEAEKREATAQLRALRDRAPTLANQQRIYGIQLEEAQELRALYEEQFKIGERTLVDLVTVQADIVRLERSRVNARYDILDLEYTAAGALGQLLPTLGLNPGEQTR